MEKVITRKKESKFKPKQHLTRFSKEALDGHVTDEELSLLKKIKGTKGVVFHIANLNDPITELGLELASFFRIQRAFKKNPMSMKNLSDYAKAAKVAEDVLAQIKLIK